MGQITDTSPIIHMAHQFGLFAQMPEHVSLTLSGHAHGGRSALWADHPSCPHTMETVTPTATLLRMADASSYLAVWVAQLPPCASMFLPK